MMSQQNWPPSRRQKRGARSLRIAPHFGFIVSLRQVPLSLRQQRLNQVLKLPVLLAQFC